MDARTNVALLGTGHMGAAMGRRLLATGHSLTVWNRTAARAAAPGEAGASVAATSQDAVRDAAAVLADLGTVRDCGPIGAGTGMKLVVNTALLTALGGLRDALAVAEALGVRDPMEVLSAGPVQGVAARASSPTASFAVALAAKDLRLAVRELQDAPVAAAVLDLLDSYPDRDADVAAITRT